MVRITIDVDGTGVTTTTTAPADVTQPQPTAAPAPRLSQLDVADVRDAGAAPATEPATGAALAGEDATEVIGFVGDGDTDAGAGPATA